MKPFENIEGKEENAGNQHFHLFPQCFLPITERISVFELHLFCRLQTHPKVCLLVKCERPNLTCIVSCNSYYEWPCTF